jgi:hypothetical protein
MPPRIPGDPSDDGDEWMARVTALSDHDVDQLIAGRTPEGMHDLAPVAQVSLALRERTAFEIAPVMGPSLRQALADAPALTTRNTGRIRRRLSGMAAAGVGVFALGAATAANALPAPVQAIVSEAGELLGVEVPHPDDHASDEGHHDVGPEVPSTDDVPVPGGDRGSSGAPGANGGEEPGPEDIGPPATTPAGTTPADPGTPGDHEPATPARPATGGDPAPKGTTPETDHPTGASAEDHGVPVDAGAPAVSRVRTRG